MKRRLQFVAQAVAVAYHREFRRGETMVQQCLHGTVAGDDVPGMAQYGQCHFAFREGPVGHDDRVEAARRVYSFIVFHFAATSFSAI